MGDNPKANSCDTCEGRTSRLGTSGMGGGESCSSSHMLSSKESPLSKMLVEEGVSHTLDGDLPLRMRDLKGEVRTSSLSTCLNPPTCHITCLVINGSYLMASTLPFEALLTQNMSPHVSKKITSVDFS
jgi:hypothetical protein